MTSDRTIKSICIMMLLTLTNHLFATHNRAGEIRVVQISALKVRATIITFTKSSSTAADRDTLMISWGDGQTSPIGRQNGKGEFLPNDIKKNIYETEHDYPFRGSFVISLIDPNRIDNILNVDPPNSVNIPFYIQTVFTLINLQVQGKNNTVSLLNDPIDFACVGQTFSHNPAAYDVDGDSLAFELITPLMDVNTPVPNYSLPSQIMPGLNNMISFNKEQGTFTWQSPQKAGEYNIAFVVHEFRKGVRISSLIRDMQILVLEDCNKNRPPQLSAIKDTCIIAGQFFELNISASDADIAGRGSLIKLEASGAPFLVRPSATFNVSKGFNPSPLKGKFTWNTDCSLVRKEAYSVVFKATDNLLDTTGISSLVSWRIKIIAPAPTNLIAAEENDNIKLQWDLPYYCNDGVSDFRGFSIWRKEGSLVLEHDTCNPGLQGKEYVQIANLINTIENGKYTFIDNTISRGKFYCYRIQAEFAKLSSSGIPYNFVASLHSNETCLILLDDRPVLLNADVRKTSASDGSNYVRWQKPSTAIYDTIKYLPPYEVQIWHKSQNSDFANIPESNQSYSSFSAIKDTEFLHLNINTTRQHLYFILLRSQSQKSVYSDTGSTIYLSLIPGDKKTRLSWKSKVPWNNYEYSIYRSRGPNDPYVKITTTKDSFYTDFGLINDSVYCYKVEGFGTYGIQQIPSPLINWSQEECATVKDTEPPCCPKLKIKDPCQSTDPSDTSQYIQILQWNNPNLSCLNPDAIGYRIFVYYEGDKPELLAEIEDINQLGYAHNINQRAPLCYGIESYDLNQNACSPRDTVCPEYCPIYRLPNAFTPNGDGSNDLFKPYPFRFVEKVDMKIFNRWGQLVFETTDPNILWDGKNKSGNLLANGTYYYQCLVIYSGLTKSTKSEQLNGFIELLGK